MDYSSQIKRKESGVMNLKELDDIALEIVNLMAEKKLTVAESEIIIDSLSRLISRETKIDFIKTGIS